nr:MAG TPA: CLLAC-motif containing domain protein [Caudoviricetes sp.]
MNNIIRQGIICECWKVFLAALLLCKSRLQELLHTTL